jgi:hypothetical protein
MEHYLNVLVNPSKLYTRKEILQRNSPVPKEPGVYAWYFKETPPMVPLESCVIYKDLILLYARAHCSSFPEFPHVSQGMRL